MSGIKKKTTIPSFRTIKARGDKVTMITVYDYPFARLVDRSAAEMILVGDSLGMVIQGLEQTNPVTLDEMSRIWAAAREAGHALTLLNIGGGFPAFYGEAIEGPEAYAARVMELVAERFGAVERVMAEPGRGLVAEAGVIACEVMLVSRKSERDMHRWVYLDIGKFSGLAETMDEAIRYQFVTPRDGDAMGPCIMAGPSCDSADVLYEKRPVMLPMSLRAGDRVLIRNTGAYTSSYSSVGFNGFPPLDVVVM